MRHFEVIGETGRTIGEIWARDEATAKAIADAIYAATAHVVRAVFAWEEAHASAAA